MSQPDHDRPATDETQLVKEMAAIPHEPLLPIEKKLIAWSLILGIGLLGLLAWLGNTYFPVPPAPR